MTGQDGEGETPSDRLDPHKVGPDRLPAWSASTLILRVTCSVCGFHRSYTVWNGDVIMHEHERMPWGLWRSGGTWVVRRAA